MFLYLTYYYASKILHETNNFTLIYYIVDRSTFFYDIQINEFENRFTIRTVLSLDWNIFTPMNERARPNETYN